MPAAADTQEYQPVYIVEIYLESGLYVFSTKDVEILPGIGSGYGLGGYGEGAYGD